LHNSIPQPKSTPVDCGEIAITFETAGLDTAVMSDLPKDTVIVDPKGNEHHVCVVSSEDAGNGDVPQDTPLSPPGIAKRDEVSNAGGSPVGSDLHLHPWVSPNRSNDEPGSSNEKTSHDYSCENTPIHDNKSPTDKMFFDESISIESDGCNFCEEFVHDANDMKEFISISGERVQFPPEPTFDIAENLNHIMMLDASRKDVIKISHQGRDILMPLPIKVSDM